jgi:hypothetical protein
VTRAQNGDTDSQCQPRNPPLLPQRENVPLAQS